MPKLPDSLSFVSLMQGAIPGDITLGESKVTLASMPSTKALVAKLKAVKPNMRPLVIRFVDEELHDLPDSMPMDTFRALCDLKMASIIVEEGDGGSSQPIEMVD